MIFANATILASIVSLFNNGSYTPPIDAYIIPAGDAHKSEYVSRCHDRRSFVTGFDGSAGLAILLVNATGFLWTDSRYWVQAEQQLNNSTWTLMRQGGSGVLGPNEWLAKSDNGITNVGVDPELFSKSEWDALEVVLKPAGKNLVPSIKNLIDDVWENYERPACSNASVFALEDKYSGKNTSEKLKDLRDLMTANDVGMIVVSDLDEVAWLLNLRGNDIDYNPYFFAYVAVRTNDFVLYIDQDKLSPEIENQLTNSSGQIEDYELARPRLKTMAALTSNKIWVSKNANRALVNDLLEAVGPNDSHRVISRLSPIATMKAVKNPVEVVGMINAHIRDGAAVVEYFAWLGQQMQNANHSLTEIKAADELEKIRFRGAPNNLLVSLSFGTISASGPNAALPHYSPTPTSDRALSTDEIYLVDSGGQYYDGTTDITRTLHFGTPSEEIKNAYTRVLKGNIAVRTQVFPRRTYGSSLDALARKPLWDDMLNFGHGTGHGIGSFLGVHEGPFSLGSRTGSDDPGLDENMFMSDEPGFYKEGDGGFGIRIENILRTVKANEEGTFLKFEDVTMCPIQMKMINPDMMTEEEIRYLDDYHKRVRETLEPVLRQNNASALAIEWLTRETLPLNEYRSSANSLFGSSFLLIASLFLGFRS